MIPNGFSPEEPKKGDGLRRGDAQGLIDISRIKGWDPTKIAGFSDAEGGDISQFDKPTDSYRTQGNDLGKLDNAVPVSGTDGATGGPVLNERLTWNNPDESREAHLNGHPKMTLSDPEPGVVDY
jgi:hypothetical protein